ncbi:MAG: 1-acyl-sn-glycerol-3-phosphate acyltransferase [Pseudonocardiaceae bacterium]|nr:1-acyl-sn-glycerol-3-phosphate acyltransferase [Pseudonocardiaceae bacterium]
MTHAWMPVSPCGAGCLPAAGAVPAAGCVRQACRLLAVGLLLVAGAGLFAVLPLLPGGVRERTQRRWFRLLLAALEIRIRITGEARFAARGQPVLVVSNHVSWLDLVALSAVQPVRLVAKSEVRDLLLIGPLATLAGTVYVDRERLRSLPDTVGALTRALRRGAAVGAFPEGTTWCGVAGGRFRPALFQAAVDAGAAVRPVAVNYRVADRPTTVTSFVGDATMWRSLVTVAGVLGVGVQVQVLPTIPPSPEPTLEAAADAVTTWGRAARRRALAGAADRAVREVALPALPRLQPTGVVVPLEPSICAGIEP